MQQHGSAPLAEQRPFACRGVRGATTVSRNDPEEILAATRELL
ncbi:MAG: chorismate mutase, partial [Anaerolineales bacterium]|nr:chorismate mutase [Anaerolineales bacterium]